MANGSMPAGVRWRLASAVAIALSVLMPGLQPPATAEPPSYNGLALTPPMGFNDWQHYRCDITEQTILSNATALVTTGLARHGYNYVNVDDCWMASQRDADGVLQANPATFPHGIGWLAGQVHRLGLKFGIYQDGGYRTCGGFPGMYGHIQQDADTFASWGVDFLKLDYCNQPTDQYPGDSPAQVAKIVYAEVSRALLSTHRPIVFSESAPAYFCCTGPNFTDIMSWVGDTGNLWRFGDDIQPSWSSILTNYREDNTPGLAAHAGPGRWNDADMLLAGTAGTTPTEQQSQFSLWAELASPLLLSADLGSLSPQTIAMLSNQDVLAVDQDPLGAQGTIVHSDADADVLAKPLANGDAAIALFNKSATARNISTSAGNAGGYRLTDLWSHQTTETTGTISADVPAHGVALYRVHRSKASWPPPSVAIVPDVSGTRVTIGIQNNGSSAISDVTVGLSAPPGWTVRPATQRIPSILPGHTQSVTLTAIPAPQPPGTTYTTLTVQTSYRTLGGRQSLAGQATATTVVPYPSLAAAFGNVGVTDDNNTNPPNLGPAIDNYGETFSAKALAAAGVAAGGTVSSGGLVFTWPSAAPGQPNNVVANGQIINLSGSGGTLGFLATAGFGPAGGTGTITYTDGSTQAFTLSAPDWTFAPADATVAVSMPYHNVAGTAPARVTTDIYRSTVPIDPAKKVASVTLPVATGGSGLSMLHVFALAIA
ncbi:NEW3 domain-containing protein [Kutzneria chonburiensis]|uniref:Alpha-galactosidase n=1 Tax=Kutzneria chonburiensis TaxID=1483604 RepID=A0ABV6MJG0_9PSEU|nr:NEW3 domain-containing protein [Kutzneria chonburiensis]